MSGPRILHAPSDVGGNAWGLSRAERELGLESDVAVFAAGPFGYGADIRLDLEGAGRARQLAARARFMRRAIRDYDVFHFNFGQTLVTIRELGLVLNELPLLKRLGKTVLATFQGCDVRPKSECYCQLEQCVRETPYRAPNAARIMRYADRVFYLNPDLGRHLPGARFTPYASVDPRSLPPAPERERDELVVVHAPSERNVKGTRFVVEAVESLRAEGVSLRLDLLEGLPHEEVLRRTGEGDLVVDQLNIGWYGAFAVEAMAQAVPVLCRIKDEENPFGAELPLVRTTRETLREDLRALAGDRDRRRELGQAGRRFAEEHHDPRKIARSVLEGVVL